MEWFVTKFSDYMYEIPFFIFILNYAFIVITAVVITVNLVSCELVILTGMNGRVHNTFEIKSLNSNSPASRGRLVCVYPYF